MNLKNLTAHLFTRSETAGEHGRGDIVHAELVAMVLDEQSRFLGNWIIRKYYGPEALQLATQELNLYKEGA